MKRATAAVAAALCVAAFPACDQEDVRDAEEIGRQVEEGAENVGEKVENEVDQIDSDGKDDK